MYHTIYSGEKNQRELLRDNPLRRRGRRQQQRHLPPNGSSFPLHFSSPHHNARVDDMHHDRDTCSHTHGDHETNRPQWSSSRTYRWLTDALRGAGDGGGASSPSDYAWLLVGCGARSVGRSLARTRVARGSGICGAARVRLLARLSTTHRKKPTRFPLFHLRSLWAKRGSRKKKKENTGTVVSIEKWQYYTGSITSIWSTLP